MRTCDKVLIQREKPAPKTSHTMLYSMFKNLIIIVCFALQRNMRPNMPAKYD